MFEDIMNEIRAFVTERDWDKFHTPKNLSVAISVEAGELMENFIWHDKTFADMDNTLLRKHVEEELADIVIYCLEFMHLLGTDPEDCLKKKLEQNKQKYPVDKVKGQAVKYTEIE